MNRKRGIVLTVGIVIVLLAAMGAAVAMYALPATDNLSRGAIASEHIGPTESTVIITNPVVAGYTTGIFAALSLTFAVIANPKNLSKLKRKYAFKTP